MLICTHTGNDKYSNGSFLEYLFENGVPIGESIEEYKNRNEKID